MPNGLPNGPGGEGCPEMSANVRPEEKLSAKQEAALMALLSSPSVAAAARKCGLNERTIRRYLHDPTFLSAYNRARGALLSETVLGIQATALAGVGAINESLEDEDAATRLRAARYAVEFMLRGIENERKWTELQEVLPRLDALERELEREREEG
jgi:hypothetical protein